MGVLNFPVGIPDRKHADWRKGDRGPGRSADRRRWGIDACSVDANGFTDLNLFKCGFVAEAHRILARFTFRIVIEHLGNPPLVELAKNFDAGDRWHLQPPLRHSHRHLIGSHIIRARHQNLG